MFGFFHTKITLEINVIEKPITGLMSKPLRLLKQCSGWWPVSQVRLSQRSIHPIQPSPCEKSFPTRVQGLLEVYTFHQMIVVVFFKILYILIGHERILGGVFSIISAFRKKHFQTKIVELAFGISSPIPSSGWSQGHIFCGRPLLILAYEIIPT